MSICYADGQLSLVYVAFYQLIVRFAQRTRRCLVIRGDYFSYTT